MMSVLDISSLELFLYDMCFFVIIMFGLAFYTKNI